LALIPDNKKRDWEARRQREPRLSHIQVKHTIAPAERPRYMSNSKTIIFNCPRCQAEYRIISIEAPCDVPHGKIACLKCDALFPAGDGRAFFKYFLLGRPSGRSGKRR
jgi:hypothetical protein